MTAARQDSRMGVGIYHSFSFHVSGDRRVHSAAATEGKGEENIKGFFLPSESAFKETK